MLWRWRISFIKNRGLFLFFGWFFDDYDFLKLRFLLKREVCVTTLDWFKSDESLGVPNEDGCWPDLSLE